MQLKGSQTEKNLEAALAGESIARNKYTFYSDKAKADGYEQIAELFEETAKNEKAHAQIWYNLLKEKTSTTEENLQLASDGEYYEWNEMYLLAWYDDHDRKDSTSNLGTDAYKNCRFV